MRMSKKHLISLILEELASIPVFETDEVGQSSNKEDLRKRLVEISKQVVSLKLDENEIPIILYILETTLKYANDKSAGSKLAQIQDFMTKKLQDTSGEMP